MHRGHLKLFCLILCGLVFMACASEGEDQSSVAAQTDTELSPPILSGAELASGPYDVTSTLEAYPVFESGADHPTASIQFQWSVNGNPLAGAAGETLSGENLRKDYVVFCRFSLEADKENPVETEQVTIGNALPTASGVTLSGGPFYTHSTIVAMAEAVDPDGDDTRIEFEWYVNGQLVQSGESPVLTGDAFSRGDEVRAHAVPFELSEGGEKGIRGIERATDHVLIENSAPDQPGVEIYPSEPVSDGSMYARVVTESVDPDGDTVFYKYSWYRDGELQDFPEDTTAVDTHEHLSCWGYNAQGVLGMMRPTPIVGF